MDDDSIASNTTSLSLLEQVRSREPEAWRRLSAIYGPLVYQWSRRCGLAEEDAADVVQDVFTVLAERIHEFRASGKFRGWLWVITRNKIRDQRRRRQGQIVADGGSAAYQALQQLSDDAAEPWSSEDEQRLSEHGVISRTMDLIRTEFEPSTWQAFWIATVENRTAADVAAQLGLTKHAVHQAKYRVLRRLRDELEGLD